MKIKILVFAFVLLAAGVKPLPVVADDQLYGNISPAIPQIEKLTAQATTALDFSPGLKTAQKSIRVVPGPKGGSPLAADTSFQTAYAYFMLGEIDSSVAWFKKVLTCPASDSKSKADALNYLCIDERKLGNYDQGLTYGREAYDLYQSLHDSAGMMESMVNSAKIYLYLGKRKKAMHIYMDALNYYERVKDTLTKGLIYGGIANLYMDIYQDDKGKAYYQKAIKTLQHYNSTSRYADILNNYGIVFYDEKKYDSALFYYQQAFDVYQKIGQTDAIAAASQNIGLSYVFLGHPRKGFSYLYRSLEMFSTQNLLYDKTSVMLDLGRAFIHISQFDSAAVYLNEAYKLASSLQHTYNKKEALLLLYQLSEKAGNYKDALSKYGRYISYKDSLDNIAIIKNLQEQEVKYKTAQHENEIIRLKNRELLDSAEKRQLIVGIVGMAIVLILTVVLFVTRRKKDRIIHQQKVLVHQKEKALVKAEMIRHEAHEKQLESELEFKTKQLAAHALNMMQKNKLLQDITEDIESRIKSSDCKSKEAMKQVRRSLKQGLNVDKDWDLFKLYFEQINERFFDELKKINPKLTANDYKLCALIKLNMSVKEMASVMNISFDSLKNARYRLKKKLKLQTEEKLNIFIGSI